MKYSKTLPARFIDRPNRFIAHVDIDGQIETVHVKNTGRCKELLLPGSTVILEDCDNPNRKTKYDLIAVYKEGLGLINMDSQAPNKVVKEWLETQDYSFVKSEYNFGQSRIDFYMENGPDKYLMEVKGCTLEVDGIGYFPDAPTTRGAKHLRELTQATQLGYNCIICYVIQMPGIHEVRPNEATDPEFTQAYYDAIEAGVKVLFLETRVEEDELEVVEANYLS